MVKCNKCGLTMRLMWFDYEEYDCVWICDRCNNTRKTSGDGHTEEIIRLKRQLDYLEE